MLNIKKGLYNYISKHLQFCIRLAHGAFVVLCTIIFWHYWSIFSDEQLVITIFSSIMQGFLALVGFLGTVAIFKLQLIEGEIGKYTDRIHPYMNYFKSTDVYGYDLHRTISEGEDILSNPGPLKAADHYIKHIEIGVKKLRELATTKSKIRNFLVDFSLISLVNIMIALMGIPFAGFAISHCQVFLIAVYALVSILLSYWSVWQAFRLIRISINYSFSLND